MGIPNLTFIRHISFAVSRGCDHYIHYKWTTTVLSLQWYQIHPKIYSDKENDNFEVFDARLYILLPVILTV